MIAYLDDPQTFAEHLAVLWDSAWDIWQRGGWAMGAIFANAVILFALGTRTLLRLTGKQFRHVSDKTWRMWIEQPKYREGRIGELLDEVTLAPTLPQLGAVFDGLRQAELAPIHRGLKVMKVCIAAAPLLGLLGTVTGMLATFAALAAGQGGDKTMEAVSQGISEALITTMTGLVVALPGLFCHYGLSRLRDRYAAFLARLETGCTQDLYRRIRQRSGVAA